MILGSSSSIPVTFNCFEKMSGITSTPTSNDFAVMNGDLLKAGSSAMLTSSTPTVPLKWKGSISQRHLPSHGIRQFRLDLRTEAVDVDEKRKCNQDYEKNRNSDTRNL